MSFFQTLDPYYNFSEEVVDIRDRYTNREVVTLTYNPTSGQLLLEFSLRRQAITCYLLFI